MSFIRPKFIEPEYLRKLVGSTISSDSGNYKFSLYNRLQRPSKNLPSPFSPITNDSETGFGTLSPNVDDTLVSDEVLNEKCHAELPESDGSLDADVLPYSESQFFRPL